MLRLKSYTTFPSGEFAYVQSEGVYRIFTGDGLSIEQQAKRVSDFRRANGLPRPDIAEVVYDIEVYTCQRLGGNSEWCHDTDATVPLPGTLVKSGPCSGCGARVE